MTRLSDKPGAATNGSLPAVAEDSGRGAEPPALIPRPLEMTVAEGHYTITPATRVLYAVGDDDLAFAAEYLAGRLSQAFGKPVRPEPTGAAESPDGTIFMTTAGADAALGDEGYLLTVTDKSIVIRAPKAAGAFYGGITLLQLAPPVAFRSPAMVEGTMGGIQTVPPPRPADEPNVFQGVPTERLVVPCATVWDRPRFRWRGLLVDTARHFWTIDELKQYADYLALHKMNKMHVHFTDDQNWTVEVKRYPGLTPEKAMNEADPQRERTQTYYDLARHYYTQDELKSLVAFARKRFVDVVPEFEMPGHSGAILRGLPELGCLVDSKRRGGSSICPGQEQSYTIWQSILEEMMAVFPCRYFHIGADECNTQNWTGCAHCLKRMSDEGLSDVTGLHGYFVERMSDYLRKKGRTLVGWDEILESGAKPGAVGMYWRSGHSDELVRKAAKKKQYLVMTPTAHCYFDYWQSPDRGKEPTAFGGESGIISIKKAYELQPVPDYVQKVKADVVLGVQGNLWGEMMKSFPHLLYQTYPRACALCEVAWSSEPEGGRDYSEFFARLKVHLKRLDAASIKYRTPTQTDQPETIATGK